MLRTETRRAIAGLGLAAALMLGATPMALAASSSMTINGVTVTVTDAGGQNISSTPNGIEIKVDGHTVTLENGTLSVDGSPVNAPANVTDLKIDAPGWSLIVVANGQLVYTLTDIQGLEAAAKRGDAVAMNNLGARYIDGKGVEKNVEKGLQLYEQAAAKGLPIAYRNLAFAYWIGELVAQDRKLAVDYAREAAERGNVPAQYLMGVAYTGGDGIEQSFAKAIFWLRIAARGNHSGAMNSLGIRYANGEGVDKDMTMAAEWYQKATDAGSVYAASNLAYLYWEGNGVEQNLDRAEELFEIAANAGNEIAKEALAKLRAERAGTTTDTNTETTDTTDADTTTEDTDTGAPEVAEEKLFWLVEDGKQVGPMTRTEMAEAVAAGRVNRDTLVWKPGMAGWVKAGSAPEFADFF